MRLHVGLIFTLILMSLAAIPSRAQDRVTILYDAFGESKELTKDWGFSALVETTGNGFCSTQGITPRSSSAM